MSELQLYNTVSNHIKNRDSDKEETEYIEMSDIPMFNERALFDKLVHLKNIDDDELSSIIRKNYSRILDNVFDDEYEGFYLSLFLDERFLTIFTNVISNQQNITETDRIQCNKIAYDYLTSDDLPNIKEGYREAFYNLSRRVNFQVMPKLLQLGLSEFTCAYLALARYSHTNPKIYIARMNHIITSSSDTVMTEQMIVDIYSVMNIRFSNLFRYTMFDVSTEEELNSIGPRASEVYSTISLAVVDMLNMFTSNDIKKVLSDFANEYNNSDDLDTRFSMRSLSPSDYSRILSVIDILEYENTPVP